ncbi:myocardin related transcription factor Ab isoform X2 [Scleropages formosus]|uniref:myocardin related transcription factor Ab isoform X2 n=1 Tax=Scleropages formosus TaxID=113540 RepID=UPI000877FD9D|nr:myocardin-related transcription factor A isoform X2 [Scleropages formosus]
MDAPLGEESSSGAVAPGSAPSPQSEAVTNELQELSLQPTSNLLPLQERKNVLQLKLQQRRTREELVSQGIMPPLKTPAAFHEQRKSLERARTEDYLKRKIRNRPERSELVRMHILEETSAEPALQARQLQLKRARLADDLNDKISQRPGPMELIHKNILPIHSSLKQALLELPKGTGENSSFDEDSSDALSPDQPTNQDSPLGSAPVPSPPDTLGKSSDPSPTQAPPPPPLPLAPVPSVPQKLTNGTAAVAVTKTTPSLLKLSQSKISSDRSTQRSKKPKDSKPKVKKLKYHQYIPPDQKTEREPPPQLDSSYAKILHQQQLFLQLQIINQQQQHYNYHTILPAPPKPPADQQSSSTTGPSPSRGGSTSTLAASSQNGPNRQIHPPVPLPILGPLPSNLDDFKVAELKHELKIRGLPVSGTKNDLLERLRNFQEQNAGAVTAGATPKSSPPLQLAQPVGPPHVLGGTTLLHKPGEGGVVVAAFPFVATVGGGGAQTAAPSAVVQFSSTGSSPPISPTPSERSFAGMSADEASCNGDLFGEAVSSSLTQLSLYPSPQQHSVVKEETTGLTPSCRFSQRALQSTDTLDKDQMLQEKDKQIEELMRMLRQKQRLVETLRSQLEQGKREGLDVPEVLSVKVKEEPLESAGESSCCSYCPISPDLAEKEAIKVIIKEETEEEPEEMVPELIHFEHSVDLLQAQQPVEMPQVQLSQTQQPVELPMELPLHQVSQTQRTVELPQHQPPPTQQQMELSHHQLEHLRQQQQQKSGIQLLQEQPVQLQQLQGMLLQHNCQKGSAQQQQQPPQKKKKKSQRQQQKQEVQPQQKQQQQVSPVFITQQQSTSAPASSFSLDLLKAQPTPALLTDSNGNHFLVALSSHSEEVQDSATPQGRATRNVKLQRAQSTPSKALSRSPPQQASSDPQSMPRLPQGSTLPKKEQKAKLQVSTSHLEASKSLSAPPNLEPFFASDEPSTSENSGSSSPTHSSAACLGLDQHTLFKAPSPVTKEVPPTLQQDKDNGSNQHMDDLFDILIQSGEISANFKADPEASGLRPNTPLPSPSDSPLHFSPPAAPEPVPSQQPSGSDSQLPDSAEQEVSSTGSGRLEDFLESTTGKPLLGVEPGAPVTLIDDLHSQMLSTSSILDHPPSPMDTCELTFTSQPPVLDFGDPALDGMEWLDITMGNGGSGLPAMPTGSSHTTTSVFSTDFLDGSDLHLHWDSCL